VNEESADAFEAIKGLPAPAYTPPNAPLRNPVEEQLHALLWSEANEVAPTTRPRKLKATDITQMTGLFQPRDGIDEKHVMDLFRDIRDGVSMEPVLVLAVGSRYILLDGHHRVGAYQAAGKLVPVTFYKGSVMQAVIDASAENTKRRKQVSRAERMNHAWKLVKLTVIGNPDEPMYSKTQIRKASTVSVRQVMYMRAVRKALGDGALKYAAWDDAAGAAKGKLAKAFDDDALERWAMGYADKIALVTKGMANNPEVAARTMLHVMGRNFTDFAVEVKALARLPERERKAKDDNPFEAELSDDL
jgi:hypothetical protein